MGVEETRGNIMQKEVVRAICQQIMDSGMMHVRESK